jgi:hypothetical protein
MTASSAGRGGRARDHRHALPAEVGHVANPEAVHDEEAPTVDEGHVREVHLLLARKTHGGRSAFDVHRALRHGLHPVGRGHRDKAQIQLRQTQTLLHRRGDLPAEIDRVARRLALLVLERKRPRGVAVADDEGAGLLHAVERVLRHRRQGEPRIRATPNAIPLSRARRMSGLLF